MNFFKNFADSFKNDDISLSADAKSAGEFSGWVDTGSYALNALFSGSIYGGLADNKITALAGETSTGKTFFALGIIREFLNKDPRAGVVYFDTEAAVTSKMLSQRGIDTTRLIVAEPATIQQFRTMAENMAVKYLETPEAERPPMMFVLDSLGMLSSAKELADVGAGSDTRDMTKAQLIRAAFRVLTLKLAKAKIPLIMTNHTYAVIGSYVPMQEQAGGGGVKYAASMIAFLSKKKFKDGDEVIGNVIKVKLAKGRLTRENSTVNVLLSYDTGLDRYFGLLDIAEEYGIVKKVSTRFEFPDGTKAFEKAIIKNPERYWTKEILDRVDLACREKFMYGSALETAEESADEILEAVTEGEA